METYYVPETDLMDSANGTWDMVHHTPRVPAVRKGNKIIPLEMYEDQTAVGLRPSVVKAATTDASKLIAILGLSSTTMINIVLRLVMSDILANCRTTETDHLIFRNLTYFVRAIHRDKPGSREDVKRSLRVVRNALYYGKKVSPIFVPCYEDMIQEGFLVHMQLELLDAHKQ